MQPRPLISVLIPCYNQARYLPQAIESVFSQKDTDWELLISDDASKDNSAEIIRDAASRDPRVRIQLHTANIGMAANWNGCLLQARGRYVKYLFGDDYHCAADALATLSHVLEANPSAALATSARQIVDETGCITHISHLLGPDGVQSGRDAIMRCLLAGKNLIGEPSAVMFRRELASRGFDATYRQSIDLEFWFHLLEQGNLAYISRPLCAFRRHDQQQTAVNRRSRAAESEGLSLFIKHLPAIQQYIDEGGSRHAARRAIFRSIYFARKGRVRTGGSLANEQVLMKYLSLKWYFVFWLMHRVMKPFSNIRKRVNKTVSRNT